MHFMGLYLSALFPVLSLHNVGNFLIYSYQKSSEMI